MCRGLFKYEVCQNYNFALLCKLGNTKDHSVWQYVPVTIIKRKLSCGIPQRQQKFFSS